MKLTLGLNIASLTAQRGLGNTSDQLRTVFERLSSGQRINRASDDPAGLALAEGLRADAKVYSQAIRNVNDGVSALNIADAALEELTQITTRIQELATQAANGSYSLEQRRVLDLEADALVEEFNRIVESTEFNDKKLLEENLSALTLQAGLSATNSISISLSDSFERTVGDGTFGSENTTALVNSLTDFETGDFNNDGVTDLVVSQVGVAGLALYLGNNDGTFQSGTTIVSGFAEPAFSLVTADFNGDGNLDIVNSVTSGGSDIRVILGNGDGTFGAIETYNGVVGITDLDIGDFNGDGTLDFVALSASTSQVGLFLGQGDGTFSSGAFFSGTETGLFLTRELDVGDINNDGLDDLVLANNNVGNDNSVFLGQSDGTLLNIDPVPGTEGITRYVALGDLNGDGILDVVTGEQSIGDEIVFINIGNGDGTFQEATSQTTQFGEPAGTPSTRRVMLEDINGDGLLDLILESQGAITLLGNGDGTFQDPVQSGDIGEAFRFADVNNDGIKDFITQQGVDEIIVQLGNSQQTTSLQFFSLVTEEGAQSAITELDETLERITRQRGTVGANLSRLSSVTNNLFSLRENTEAAISTITDADIAQDTAELLRLTILQQATAALLAQANQSTQLVLSLLQP